MRNFQLFLVKSDRYKILITDCNSLINTNSLSSTFDEEISFSENDQIILNFSMMKYIDLIRNKTNDAIDHRIENRHYKLLCMGAQLELVLDNREKYIFIVDKIKPTIEKNNVKFEYTCQDQVSYQWSKRNLGMSYSTVEEGGVENIYTIATKVMQRSNILDWRVKINEDNETTEGLLSDKKITLEIADSNPYNIIIEACNSLNAFMKVNYTHKYISFYQKDKIKFSGYRYHPETNLSEFDVDYDMSEMATIMHVYGGQDENGQIISLMPPMSWALEYWWSHNYSSYTEGINWNDCSGKIVRHSIFIKNDTDSRQTYEIDYYINDEYKTPYLGVAANSTGTYQIIYSADDVFEITAVAQTGVGSHEVDYEEEKEELELSEEPFVQMAKRHPSIGNFLYNFDFFEYNKLLNSGEKTNILNIIEKDMAYNNMWLKYYEPSYWNSYSYLYLRIQEAKTILENLQAARLNTIDAENDDNIKNFIEQYEIKRNEIKNLMRSLYNTDILISDFETISKDSYQIFKIDILQNLVNEYKIYLDLLLECEVQKNISVAGDDYEQALQKARKEYYTNQYYTLLSVVGSGWGDISYNQKRIIDDQGNEEIETLSDKYTATYPQLIQDLYDAVPATNTPTIYTYIQQYNQANNTLWTNLYYNYSQFLYEAKYENSDELDSISLFNQAQIYYTDYNKPKANYSVKVLELKELETIGVPQLTVGSKIKVYNKELNLNEKSSSDISEPLNNIQFTNNDLIVTSISYVLRQSENMSIGVEKISSYQSILQKLIKSVN